MINRREFSRAFTVAVAGVSLAAGCSSASDSTSDGGQSNSGSHTSFPALRQIDAGALSIGYAETGPADGAPVLLHGWPYDIYSYVDVAPLLAASGYRVIVPYLRGFGLCGQLGLSRESNPPNMHDRHSHHKRRLRCGAARARKPSRLEGTCRRSLTTLSARGFHTSSVGFAKVATRSARCYSR